MQSGTRSKENQTYYAGQWAGMGVYRCLDSCPYSERIAVLTEDGFLPDPTHGWVARFKRMRGRKAERLLEDALSRDERHGGREVGPDQAHSIGLRVHARATDPAAQDEVKPAWSVLRNLSN